MNIFTLRHSLFSALLLLLFIQIGNSQSTPCTAYRYNNIGFSECPGTIVCDIANQHSLTNFTSAALPYGDTDGDGFLDSNDNCPYVSNPTQMDSNSNGIGNVCEGIGGYINSPCGVEPANAGDVVWVQFDLPRCGNSFYMNINAPGVSWALYYSTASQQPNLSRCNLLQGDCHSLAYSGYCGAGGVPSFINAPASNTTSYTNYYLVVFAPKPAAITAISFNVIITGACSTGSFLDVVCPSTNQVNLSCISDMPKKNPSITNFNALDSQSRIIDYCGTLSITSQDFITGGSGCFSDPKYIRREYYVEDDNQMETCNMYFKIEAPSGPEITCGPYDGNYVKCPDDIHPSVDDVTFTAGCPDGASISISEPDIIEVGGPTCDLTCYHYTYTVVDECGATATCSKVWVIYEGGPHFETCKDTLYLQCGDPHINEKQVIKDWLADAEAIGGCGETMTVGNNYDRDVFRDTCGLGRIHEVMFIAKDDCGRRDTCYSAIFITDSKPPSFAGKPKDKSVTCNDDVDAIWNTWIETNGGNGNAADCCSEVHWTHEPDNYSMPCNGESGITEVTFFAWDDCGLYNSKTATFTVSGEAMDDLVLSNNAVDMTVECDKNVDFNIALNTWLDNHGGALATGGCGNSWSYNFTKGDPLTQTCSPSTGFVDVTFTVNGCDGALETTAKFTVEDTTPPTIENVPADGSMITATDNCSADDALTITSSDMGNATGCNMTRTWTVTDECGNSATATVDLSNGGADTTPPNFTFIPDSKTIDCNSNADFGTPTATDANGVTITHTDEEIASDCANGKSVTRTWTATDECGNSSTASQTISFSDNEAPTFTYLPIDLTLHCDGDLTIPMATATDNCSGAATVTFTEWLNDGAVKENCNNDYGYDIYREWTATDACGNTTKVTTVAWAVPEGYKGPVFGDRPETKDRIIGCQEDANFGEAHCTTACGNLTLVFEDSEILDDCNGKSFSRKWTAVDDCGNVSTMTQTLTVPADNEAPEITFVPEDIQIACGETFVFGTPECKDNCTVGINHFDVNFEDKKVDGCTTERTWFISDACGNMATTSQRITVMDDVAPEFKYQLEDKSGNCNANLEFDTPEAQDQCSTVELTFEDKMTTLDCGTSTTRTWSATDGCGNVKSLTQTIVLEDTEAPVFESVLENKVINCGEEIVFDTPVITDDCSEVSMNSKDEITTLECKVVHIRTWNASDVCGNAIEMSQSITVEDNTIPVITFKPEDFTVDCLGDYVFNTPTVEDNCSEVSTTSEENLVSGTCESKHTKTWTFTDACGNAVDYTQTITIVDNDAPVFVNAPENRTMTSAELLEFEMPTIELSDQCSSTDDPSFTITYPTNSCDNEIIYTWLANDACGNSSEHTMIITISDIEASLGMDTPTEIKCGDEIALDLSIDGGIAPYEISYTIEGSDGWEILEIDNQKIVVNSAEGSAVVKSTVTTKTGCTTTKEVDLVCIKTSSLDIFESISNFEISPNPATNELMVTIDNQYLKSGSIIIMNILGKTQLKQDINLNSGKNEILIDINNLVQGTYLIGLESNDKQYFTKFTKVTP